MNSKGLITALAFAASAAPALAETNIGNMDSGIYNATLDGVPCVLAVGNYGWGSSGRGYAGLSCDFENQQSSRYISGLDVGAKILSRNIGDFENGVHTIKVPYGGEKIDCKVVTGNYNWGGSGRGYTGFTCDFKK